LTSLAAPAPPAPADRVAQAQPAPPPRFEHFEIEIGGVRLETARVVHAK
jgi:hypothetical protein